MRLWRRVDVHLDDLFMRTGSPTVYKVVGLIDEPVVVLEIVRVGVDEENPADRYHHVIGSPAFAEFRKVELKEPPS